MKECIIILGMHRSGTSVLAGLISILGYYTGFDLMKPTKDNPKGYYENNKIFLLNEKILREYDASWDDYSFTIKDISSENYHSYIAAARDVIETELKYINKMVIKDPRICLLFPIWEQALSELNVQIKILFIHRNPLEVAYSLKQRDQIPLEKGLLLWTHYFFQAELHGRKYPRNFIRYSDDFTDLKVLISELGKFTNVQITTDLIKMAHEFYDPSLKHHNLKSSNISEDLPSYLLELINLLKKRKLDNTKLINKLRHTFYHDKNYYLFNEKEQKQVNIQYEQSISTLKKEIKKHKEKLDNTNKQLNNTQKQLVNTKKQLNKTKKQLIDTKKQLNDIKKDIEKQVQINSYNELKSQEKIAFLKSQALIGDEILTATLKQAKLRKSLKKTITTSGKIPLKVKQWLCLFKNKRCNRLARHKHLIIQSGLFSPYFYLTSYPDVWKSKIDPLEHFCLFGWKEGRKPSKDFNTKAYLREYPDIARSNINPLIHYITDGQREGRLADPANSSIIMPTNIIKNRQASKQKNKHLFGPQFKKHWVGSSTLIKSIADNKNILELQVIPSNIKNKALKLTENSSLQVSIIMSTWNRENSISLAINSVLKQSFSSYELIIADDGSTDNTIQLIQENYTKEITNKKIKIIKNDHQGVSACRNSALEKASGKLIAYLDSDNQWRQDYLLLMVAAFAENDELNCAYSALKSFDNDRDKTLIKATSYDRKKLLQSNFIDLNVFMHKRLLFTQLGGFDTQLKRLVDWDLIIRYTKNYQPAFLPFIGVDYFLDNNKLNNISTTVSLNDNLQRVYDTHFQERVRYGLEPLNIAYVLWDYPALSQTFVLLEIKELVKQGFDVKVYYSIQPDKPAVLNFSVDSKQVKDADDLAEHLLNDQRNLCHSHFAYPAVTLLTYPACIKTNIPFTFMPHAVDIFHRDNKARNRIGEITQHPLCLKVFVHGIFHKNFIESCGVPSDKIAFNFQAINIDDFTKPQKQPKNITSSDKPYTGIVVTRFVEKKGIESLIDTAVLLKDDNIIFKIYGYGPLENNYRKKIEQLSVSNVILKGGLATQKEVAKAYQSADFLIAPCIIAENGDMDGFPTVILEAMAMELPVITTDIAAIPNYLTDNKEALIETANNPQAMAKRIKQLRSMSEERKQALIKNAKDFLDKKIGVKLTLQRLLDTWQNYHIEIFLVTYNTEKYQDQDNTFEIIRRIFAFTTTPFTLTIIDNQSDQDFWDNLCKLTTGRSNVRLIRKQSNQYCGPASNIALELSDSEYAIYLCSKEAFIKDHGWERVLIEHMRKYPEQIIAGHPSYLPKYVYGNEYTQFPDFKYFRNQEFALNNPDKVFAHIQGGIYIIKREFIAQYGGFNPLTPHNAMDIELSYYIESLGYPLGVIPEIISITTKTLPKISTRLSETTIVAHPLSTQTVNAELDNLNTSSHGCNICHWKGDNFKQKKKNNLLCPNCSSTGFDRSIMKYLAGNHHIYRNESCITLGVSKALKPTLSSLFRLISLESNTQEFITKLKSIKPSVDYIIIDNDLINEKDRKTLWLNMTKKLSTKGEILFISSQQSSDPDFLKSINAEAKDNYSFDYTNHSSKYFHYDWRKLAYLRNLK
jgi:glycosyltransferase involved in cell wall biosynthesis